MKKIWNVLFVGVLLAGFVGCSNCDCKKLKECEQKLAGYQLEAVGQEEFDEKVEEADSASVVADLIALIGNGFLSGPIGNVSDGDTIGYNICLKYSKRKGVEASILYNDGTKVDKFGPFPLNKQVGIEIYLGGTNPDLYFSVVGPARFTHDSYSLTVGGANPTKFDSKISTACRALNPNDNPPALVGVNDARTAIVLKTNGIIGSLAGGNKIRIHTDKLLGGSFDVVFSSDSHDVAHSASYKFSDLGVPKWSCGFNIER